MASIRLQRKKLLEKPYFSLSLNQLKVIL